MAYSQAMFWVWPRSWSDHPISLTHDLESLTLTFSPVRAMVMIYDLLSTYMQNVKVKCESVQMIEIIQMDVSIQPTLVTTHH